MECNIKMSSSILKYLYPLGIRIAKLERSPWLSEDNGKRNSTYITSCSNPGKPKYLWPRMYVCIIFY